MAKRPVRIFQIAKDLNISHTEIVAFLKNHGIRVASHMSPVDEAVYQKILTEFSKEKAVVDRLRKEQVRREIHDTRVREAQHTTKKLKLLSLNEQRKLEAAEKEKEELIKRSIEAEKKLAEEKKNKAEKERKELERKKKEEIQKKTEAKSKTTEKIKSKKKKLRKIDLSQLETKSKKKRGKQVSSKEAEKAQETAKSRVRQTMAGMDRKTKKKVYKKDKLDSTEIGAVDTIKNLQIPEYSNADELSKLVNTTPSNIIQKCFGLGILASINQRLEWDVIELIVEEFGYNAIKMTDIGDELFTMEESEEDKEKAVSRAPVITVMGHVDHGKTSILDFVRNENVVAGESGGITQHVGAYKVELSNGKMVTFLDTPGHEAFTAMRARGAQVTDVVILVVAADDAVMPQTIEAINHAKAAKVPMVIAINKIDKPGIDIEKVKRELSEHNVLVEDWGGKVQSIPVSAKTGVGIDDLMDAVILEAEILELQSNADTLGRGTVVDSKLDKGLGPMATVLIQKGTIHIGDPFICNDIPGKIRAIMDERGHRIKKAGPSDAVQILGFDQVPQAADIFAVMENEKDLKRIAADRQRIHREIAQKKIAAHSLDMMSAMIKDGEIQSLPIIVKGDVDGSIEALTETLEKLNTKEVGVNVIHKSVGMVTESDVLLAEASKAVVVGFHVQVDSNARLQAKRTGVEIRTYNVIYQVVEDVTLALEGLLEPEKVEEITGRAVVLQSFKIPKIGFIAGSKVTTGHITRNHVARLLRDEEIITDRCKISSLKRHKDDVKEVKEGMECGIGLVGVSKFVEGDIIETYKITEIKRTLESS